jgi:hypothetical protein
MPWWSGVVCVHFWSCLVDQYCPEEGAFSAGCWIGVLARLWVMVSGVWQELCRCLSWPGRVCQWRSEVWRIWLVDWLDE